MDSYYVGFAALGVIVLLISVIILLIKRIIVLNGEAEIDFLTKVLNQRGFKSRIESILPKNTLEAGRRSKDLFTDVGLVMIDVDNFKHVNDNYGHKFGDEVLKSVAQAIQSSIRQSDFVCRWGGDEFVVALPNISLDDIDQVRKSIASAVNDLRWDDKRRFHVRVSVGDGSIVESMNDFSKEFETADQAMYKEKRSCQGDSLAGITE